MFSMRVLLVFGRFLVVPNEVQNLKKGGFFVPLRCAQNDSENVFKDGRKIKKSLPCTRSR